MMPTLYAPPVLEGPEHLYGVSRPEFQEAPSSWLSRAAMSQDIELDVMCRWLGLSSARDMDVALAESDLAQIACRCNFDAGAFGCVAPMMYTCKALHLKMPLLLQEHGCANYRFCPLCLKEQATPHIPLHWRFSPCRMCLVHQCLLEVRCLRCGAWVTLPRRLRMFGVAPHATSFLSQCQACGAYLWKMRPLFLRDLVPHRLSPLDVARLRNGCALVAAIALRRMVCFFSKRMSLEYGLPLLERQGYFVDEPFPDADQLRDPRWHRRDRGTSAVVRGLDGPGAYCWRP